MDAGLDGVSADDQSVLAVFRALGRDIDNQINLMTQHQIQDIGGLLLQLANLQGLHPMGL